MSNKAFRKNNESISPEIVRAHVTNDNDLKILLSETLSRGGVSKIVGGRDKMSLSDMMQENSRIPGVVENAEVIIPGFAHKVDVTFVTSTSGKKYALDFKVHKKPEIKKNEKKDDPDQIYNETYGGLKKKPIPKDKRK